MIASTVLIYTGVVSILSVNNWYIGNLIGPNGSNSMFMSGPSGNAYILYSYDYRESDDQIVAVCDVWYSSLNEARNAALGNSNYIVAHSRGLGSIITYETNSQMEYQSLLGQTATSV